MLGDIWYSKMFKCVVLFALIINVRCQSVLHFYEENLGTLSDKLFENIPDKTKVQLLDIRGNGIVRILDTALQGFDNLETLELSVNFIECLPEDVFHGVQNVKELTMYSNQFRYLPKDILSKLRKLERLNLSINLLTKLEVGLFDNSQALRHLNLRNNMFTYIAAGIFSKLNNLQSLDLGANYIHYVDRNALPSAVPTKLENFWLWANRLEKLFVYENILNSLKVANFDKNPWYCDCNLKAIFRRWKSSFQPFGWSPECQGPEHLKDRLWTTLQESDFVCDQNVVHFNVESNKLPQIGEDLTLACHINIPVGDITITYKNGTNVVDHLRRHQRYPSIQSDTSEEHSWYKLRIKDVQAIDAGYYKCVINGKAERQTYLTVDDPSQYEKCLVNIYFLET